QAEGGIRVFHGTGVQTCALPIYAWAHFGLLQRSRALSSAEADWFGLCICWQPMLQRSRALSSAEAAATLDYVWAARDQLQRSREIGRASCRERARTAV